MHGNVALSTESVCAELSFPCDRPYDCLAWWFYHIGVKGFKIL